jgi:glycerol kinase
MIQLQKSKLWQQAYQTMEAFIFPALTGFAPPLGPICERRNWVLQEERQTVIARATLEGIAYQVYDLAKSMEADFGEKERIKVDGGAAANNLMMQFQRFVLDSKR